MRRRGPSEPNPTQRLDRLLTDVPAKIGAWRSKPIIRAVKDGSKLDGISQWA
jgi:hypothetical protein